MKYVSKIIGLRKSDVALEKVSLKHQTSDEFKDQSGISERAFFISVRSSEKELGVSAVGSSSDCRIKGPKVESQLGHIDFVEIDCEIFSLVILPFPLIQEESLPVTGKTVYSKYWLITQND